MLTQDKPTFTVAKSLANESLHHQPAAGRAMPSYSVSVPHALGQLSARQRVESFLETVLHDYAQSISDVNGQWTENRLAFRFITSGLTISGLLVVEETLVAVSGPLPLAAVLFRGRIEQQIRAELERLLS